MKSQMMIVLVTCGSQEEAKKIANSLIGSRYAACVNIVPGVESCYVWEGKLTWDKESLLIIKTTKAGLERVRSCIDKEHSYSVPEFIVLKIEDGSDSYLKWIEASVETNDP